MKKIAFFMMVACLLAACVNTPGGVRSDSANAVADTGKAVISFTNLEHDFGDIVEGEKVGCIFKYYNTGTSDLVVKSASASCGCTVPKYDIKPIAPGESGSMEVIFDATGYHGFQSKTVTVKSNADVPVMVLKITANVKDNNN